MRQRDRLLALLLSLLPLLALCGCGGGSNITPPPAIPVIAEVTPTGVIGSSGGWVRLHATATNTPTSWTWSLGGGGTTTDTTASPRVTLAGLGTYTGQVIATNAEGDSAPGSFTFEVAETPVAPQWPLAQVIQRQPINSDHRILITSESIVIYTISVVLGEPAGQETDTAVAVAPRSSTGEVGAWTVYTFEGPDRFNFPATSPRYGLDIMEHAGRVFVQGSDGGDKSVVAVSSSLAPLSQADWVNSLAIRESQVFPGFGAEGRLAVVGDKPCVIAADAFSFELGVIYTNYIAIANTPAPQTEADWTLIRLPDESSGSSQDTTNVYSIAAIQTPDGGLSFSHNDNSGRMEIFHANSEAAVRANEWQSGFVTSYDNPGSPIDLLVQHDRLILTYWQLESGGAVSTDRLGLAYSGDPTGMTAPWTIKDSGFRLTSGVRAPGAVQLWGDRLIAIGGGGSGIQRALTSAMPGPSDWEELTFDDGRDFPTSLSANGLDCYMLYTLGLGEETTFYLSTAEGSW